MDFLGSSKHRSRKVLGWVWVTIFVVTMRVTVRLLHSSHPSLMEGEGFRLVLLNTFHQLPFLFLGLRLVIANRYLVLAGLAGAAVVTLVKFSLAISHGMPIPLSALILVGLVVGSALLYRQEIFSDPNDKDEESTRG